MTLRIALEVRPAGRGFAIFAGCVQLQKAFPTREACQQHLDKNRAFFAYWAGSASVSVDNAPARVINA